MQRIRFSRLQPTPTSAAPENQKGQTPKASAAMVLPKKQSSCCECNACVSNDRKRRPAPHTSKTNDACNEPLHTAATCLGSSQTRTPGPGGFGSGWPVNGSARTHKPTFSRPPKLRRGHQRQRLRRAHPPGKRVNSSALGKVFGNFENIHKRMMFRELASAGVPKGCPFASSGGVPLLGCKANLTQPRGPRCTQTGNRLSRRPTSS